MCRLAMMNREGIKHVEREYGLENLFDYLERQLGGHGRTQPPKTISVISRLGAHTSASCS